MPRTPASKIDPSTVAVHNWEQRAKQLFTIADAMGNARAAAVLQKKAQDYLRHARAGDAHAKQLPQASGVARGATSDSEAKSSE
jgi:hypothetical protein